MSMMKLIAGLLFTSTVLTFGFASSASRVNIPVLARVNWRSYKLNVSSLSELQEQIEKVTKIPPTEQELFIKNVRLNVSDARVLERLGPKDIVDVKRRAPVTRSDLMFRQAMNRLPKAQMNQVMEAMAKLFENEKLIDEFFSNAKKMELARQHVLNNINLYEKAMPGFKAQTSGVINDSDKWREAMMQAREQLDEVRKSARVKQKNVTSVGRV